MLAAACRARCSREALAPVFTRSVPTWLRLTISPSLSLQPKCKKEKSPAPSLKGRPVVVRAPDESVAVVLISLQAAPPSGCRIRALIPRETTLHI